MADKKKDYRERCRYCLNEDTKQLVLDTEGLDLYKEYHKGNPFKVFYCSACRATWHFKI